jgi:hypothetical protein
MTEMRSYDEFDDNGKFESKDRFWRKIDRFAACGRFALGPDESEFDG